MAKARRVNVEGSVFGLRRAKGSVKSKESASVIKGKSQNYRRRRSVQLKESDSTLEAFQVVFKWGRHGMVGKKVWWGARSVNNGF